MLHYDDFKALIFLHTPKLSKLVSSDDRSLEKTAKNALKLLKNGNTCLDSNWDLDELTNHFNENFAGKKVKLPHLVLRDVKSGEKTHPNAKWYLQDGCHRALGYMIYLIDQKEDYTEQLVYVATNQIILD